MERLEHELLALVHREHHHLGRRRPLGELAGGLQPGQARHRDVEVARSTSCSPASRTASAPSPASATTCRSGSASSRSRRPRRTIGWSSASRTRAGPVTPPAGRRAAPRCRAGGRDVSRAPISTARSRIPRMPAPRSRRPPGCRAVVAHDQRRRPVVRVQDEHRPASPRDGPRWSASPGRRGRRRAPPRRRARRARGRGRRVFRPAGPARAARSSGRGRRAPRRSWRAIPRATSRALADRLAQALEVLVRRAARPAARLAAISSPVRIWPTSSCSSRAIRRRSASCGQRRRPLSRRSLSSRSSMSLNASASAADVCLARVISIRRPGGSGSIGRIVASGAERRDDWRSSSR